MDEATNAILKVMESFGRPVTAKELAEEFNMSQATLYRIIKKLLQQEKIIRYQNNTGEKYAYYAVANKSNATNDNTELMSKYNKFVEELSQKYIELDSGLQMRNDEIEKRIIEVENLAKTIYINIISIMAVFVAIFALIITNVNIVQNCISNNDSYCQIIFKELAINVPMLIVIVLMLVSVRILIINPLKKEKRRKNR